MRRASFSSSFVIAVISEPFTVIEPCDGFTRRFTQRTKVDFPLPESPMTQKNSPSYTSNDTPARAIVTPSESNISSRLKPSLECCNAVPLPSSPKIT